MTDCTPLVMVGFEGAELDDARFVSAVLEIVPFEGGTIALITPFGRTRPDSPEVESVEFDEAAFSSTKSDEADDSAARFIVKSASGALEKVELDRAVFGPWKAFIICWVPESDPYGVVELGDIVSDGTELVRFISCPPFGSSFDDMELDSDELGDIELDVVKLADTENGQPRFWLRSSISPDPPGDPFNTIELEDVEGIELDGVELDVDEFDIIKLDGVELDVDEFDIIELEKLEDVELDEVVPGMGTTCL
ncbi:hypothetical protein ABVK25_005117 [Lepraria finkii]|uniref:Uncharacterized protein n=1 Tax=Lepraria finkii TaxID=1340010 RepID=A0ABR4BBL2_9LECA